MSDRKEQLKNLIDTEQQYINTLKKELAKEIAKEINNAKIPACALAGYHYGDIAKIRR
jgi:hypothetical protein